MENIKIYTIYKATNTLDNKSYIGFDSKWPARKNHHMRTYKTKKYCPLFHRAINKHGIENLQWEILYQSMDGQDTLKRCENYFIVEHETLMPNGYNMTLGGEGVLGLKLSKESIEKSRKKNLGKKMSQETKQKISKSSTGIIKSKEWRENLSKSLIGRTGKMLGKKHNNETIVKMSYSRKKIEMMRKIFETMVILGF